MEVRKATSSQITEPQIDQKSEVTKTKSAALNPIADLFQKETSQSSSSNASSSASSEPEKKAGQITGGILIKQMTAARIGETNAKQSSEVSGKKDLSPEQQSRVSNSDPRKKNLDSSFFLQDARSKDEDRKNSGLQPPFASNKGYENSRLSKVDKDQVTNASGSEQTSNAVKDADRLVDGGSLRSQVDAEVAERHQDTNAIGGSRTDQLSDLLNPTAGGPQQSSQTGKEQLAYSRDSERHNNDGTTTKVHDYAGPGFDGKFHEEHAENTEKKDGTTLFQLTDTRYTDDSKVVRRTTDITDTKTHETKSSTTTTTTTKNDGTVIVETSTTKKNKDGSTTTNTTTTTTPGGGTKSYDQENYTGNIPDEMKKTLDYFKQQAIGQRPQSGGETAHTDDNAEADPTVGGRVSNLVAQQGNVGLFGNPGSANSQTGLGGGQGHVGSSQSGGNIDPGQDSDNPGYTGVTHQEDPGDVQFGPQSPAVKDAVDSKNADDTDNDSNVLIDILNRNRKKGQ